MHKVNQTVPQMYFEELYPYDLALLKDFVHLELRTEVGAFKCQWFPIFQSTSQRKSR